jgi:hypothetical protein
VGDLWIVLDYDQPGFGPPSTLRPGRWLPQHAWLDGTVLVVERGSAVRQCDLAAASKVTLRAGMLDKVHVLRAYEAGGGQAPVALAIMNRFERLFVSPDALRLLAQATGSRPGCPARVTRNLRNMADREERRNTPIDWSFRIKPRG